VHVRGVITWAYRLGASQARAPRLLRGVRTHERGGLYDQG
jgi:hypothetical protein